MRPWFSRCSLLVLLPVLPAQDAPDGLSAGDWSGIRAAYEAGRHAVAAADGGHRARSPNQHWNVHFDGRGVEVHPDAGDWSWGLDLVAFGCVGSERQVGVPAAVHVAGQRVEYRWSEALDEWYENRAGGLEHGYTLHRRPEGDGTLTFVLRVRGGLAPAVEGGGRDVVFRAGAATLLDYRGLHVFDADGRTLPARFAVEPHGLRLSIDATVARYPVTIDPVAQHAYLKASNTGADDGFAAVAISGDTIVVGAPREDSNASGVNGNQANNSASDSGAAYVFVRSGGSWVQQAYLKASNTGAGDAFGCSVAISGDTVVVGACAEDSVATGVNGNQTDNSATESGAAYVFVRSGSTWTQQAYLKATNTGAGDWFATSVAIEGDTLVVGATEEDSNATGVNGNQANNSAWESGAAYVFVRTGSTWTQQAYLKASNTGAGDGFGFSVAISGDTVGVGAVAEASSDIGVNGNQADNSAPNSGAAYVFVRSGTMWSQQAYLKASNTLASHVFGYSLAISGDTVVVSGPNDGSGATGVDGNPFDTSAPYSGAAYVFVRSGSTWTQQAYLKASNTGAGDGFGVAVAMSGDTLVIGAYSEDANTRVDGEQSDNGAAGSGAAYVFVRSGSTWMQRAYLKASHPGPGDAFGAFVAISDDTVVASALGEDSGVTGVNGSPFGNSAIDAGAVYVFDLRSGSLGTVPVPTQLAYLKASNSQAADEFGQAIAISGDTVVVGAHAEDSNATGVNGNQADNSKLSSGAAYVFVRTGGTWSQQAYLKASNTDANDVFGWSVAISDDTIVVGAFNEDSNATGVNGTQSSNSAIDSGAAYVFVRNGTTWSQQAYLKASNTDALDAFGASVAVANDTIVVGAYAEDSSAAGVNGNQADNGASSAGAAYVFVRAGTTWSQQAYLKASNTATGDQFGNAVAIAGDTIAVAAFGEDSSATGVNGNQADNGATNAGAVYVFTRTGTTWSQQAYLKASNTGASDAFGTALAASGDTIVVGANGEDSSATGIDGDQVDNSAALAGAAYVFRRSGGSWQQQAYLKASNTGVDDRFGTSVAIAGDTVVVGAEREAGNATGVDGNQAVNSATEAGAAYVFHRSGATWRQRAYLKASNTNANDRFGHAVAIHGDTAVVGGYLEDSNATGIDGNQANNSAGNAGAVYAFSVARLRPRLWPMNVSQIGQDYTLALDHLDPAFNLAVLGFGFVQLPLPGLDLGFLGLPGGDLYQTPDVLVSVPVGAGGSAAWTWNPVTGLPGDRLYCQALCFDPNANALGFTISNQVTITLVP